MKLQPWLVNFVYLPGKESTLADALSRQNFKEAGDYETRPESCPSLPRGGGGVVGNHPHRRRKEKNKRTIELLHMHK